MSELETIETAGDGDYEVRPGDCIESIAFEHGFFPETLWQLPENAALKDARGSGSLLQPGDRVHVPALRAKTESGATDAKHTFRRKGVPSELNVQLKLFGEPRAHENYTLEIEERLIHGSTDADGWIREPLPPGARSGKLLLRGGEEQHRLYFGALNPVRSPGGLAARLSALGYYQGDPTMADDDAVIAALIALQVDCGLDATGELDADTEDALRQRHGC